MALTLILAVVLVVIIAYGVWMADQLGVISTRRRARLGNEKPADD